MPSSIRDLFEHFLPESQHVQRLGSRVDEAALLAIKGSVDSGKRLFELAADVNCRSCHKIGTVGREIGPSLSGIGTQQTPAEILRSILHPSEKIDPQYLTKQIVTVEGNVLSGILIQETDQEIHLVDAAGQIQ